jgi:pimeloyl-ACP methyl ester carboxylesterase
VLCGNSYGGVVITEASAGAQNVVRLVYLAAFMPASGVPSAAYPRMPENEGSRVGALRVGDARATGALRLDVASPDPAYREAVRETFYGDVDPVTADAAIALLTPDAPVGISAGVTALTADGWGSIPRTYVVCTGDATIPPALQRKFITDADAAFPGNRTAVRELKASHSPFLSMPDQVAGIVLDVLS